MHNFKMLFILCALLAAAGCSEPVEKKDPIRPVRAFKIMSGSDAKVRSFPGKVEANREVSLAFRIPGQVVDIQVKEGDFVTKGQLIAKLDQRDIRATVADLSAKLAGARSVLNEARLNYERNKELLASDTIAQAAFDTAKSNFESSRASALSLEQELKKARLNLQYTQLTAPFSGTIAMVSADTHEYVQAKESIVQLEDVSALDVSVNVPENLWMQGFRGEAAGLNEVTASFESLPGKVFPLTLKEFQTKANTQTQTYEVTFTMANPGNLGIHPGMTAEVRASLSQGGEARFVSVPFSCVTGTPGNGKYVWIVRDKGTVHKQPVTTGRITDDMMVIKKGLSQGDTVVSAGVDYLCEGQKVRVLEGRIGGRG